MRQVIALSIVLAVTAMTAAAARPTKQEDARAVALLLQQGQDATTARRFKAARDAFLDAVSIDKKNPAALEGAGTAYLQLQDFPHARPLLEQAADAAGPGGP